MLPTFAGYEAVEEVRTDAFTVVYRARRVGENGETADYQIRTLRNPAGIVDPIRWKSVAGGRLAAIDVQRRAAEKHAVRLTPLLESGESDGVIFDITPSCALTVRDLILQRVALDGRELFALATGVVEALTAFHESADRAHGRVEPESVRILTSPIDWKMRIALDLAAPPSEAIEGVKGDLKAFGRLLYELARFEKPGLRSPDITADATAFGGAGRRAVGWRRLCKELMTGGPEVATLEQVGKRVRALRPPTPAQSRRRAILGSSVAVIALAGGAYFVSRPGEKGVEHAPDEDLFYDLERLAATWRAEWAQREGAGVIEMIAADQSMVRNLDLLSLNALRQKEELSKWSGVSLADFTRSGVFEHDLIDWTRPAVEQWWQAYESLRTLLVANLVEPLTALAAQAEQRGWTQQASAAQTAVAEIQERIDAEDYSEVGPLVASASAQFDQLTAWLAQIADVEATVNQAVATIAATPARAPGPDGQPVAVNEALRAWADRAGRALDAEAPDDTIRRYRDTSAAVIESVADAARYWANTPEFMADEFIAASDPLRPDDLANPAEGRRVLLAWASRVQEPRFLNIGSDPRPALLARRDDLSRQVDERMATLSDEDRRLSQERYDAFGRALALVQDALGAQTDAPWSATNEQPIRQAVAAGDAQLALAADEWTDLQNFLEERQNIEARRSGVIARATELAQEHGGWLGAQLQPLIARASSAGPDQIEPTVEALSQEVQRLRPIARMRDTLQATVASIPSDPRIVGDALRGRAQALFDQWTRVAATNETENLRLQSDIETLGRLSTEATSLAGAIDQRAIPSTSPGLLDQTQAFLAALRQVGVDPAAGAQGGRLLRVLTQLEPYLAAEGNWSALLARLRADVTGDAFRSESLLIAYAMLRDAESSASPALSLADIELERDIRSRLAAAVESLPASLGSPAIAARLDVWLATRPPLWTDAAAAQADIARAMSLVGAESQPDPSLYPALAAASLIRQMQAYQGPTDNDAEVLARATQFQASLATVRQALPGGTPWYSIIEDLDDRLTALQSGESGPTLSLELLQTAGPAARGWSLRGDSTIERPTYERNGIALEFILDDQQETPVFVGRRELSLAALQEVITGASGDEWGAFGAHAPLKDWGIEPDFQQLARTARAYFVTEQRAIMLFEDWLVPAAIHIESGQVAWDAHYQQVYGADASNAQRWRPSMEMPAHLIGFQAALAVSRAVGCRLPTPDEWAAALSNIGGVDASPPNVSDATWSRQQARSGREAPAPWLGSFFPFGRTDAPAAYETSDDAWLWLRPTPEPGGSTVADMLGNVAEWADLRATERAPDSPLEISAEEVQADAVVMGVSSMSGAGANDQRVTVGNRSANRAAFTTSRDGYGMGFADVGLRLFFDVGATKPKSASEQFAADVSSSLLAARPDVD